MKIITKSILTIATILFAGGCATPLTLEEKVVGLFEQSIEAATIRTLFLDDGELYFLDGLFRGEAGWKIDNGHIHVSTDPRDPIIVLRLNPESA